MNSKSSNKRQSNLQWNSHSLATCHHLLLNRPAIQLLKNLLKVHPHISELKGLPTQSYLNVAAVNASPPKTSADFTANTATTISASAAALMGKRLRAQQDAEN
jgi:hypothetical protein